MGKPWENHGKTMENHGKTMGKPWENGGLMGFYRIYPQANVDRSMDNHHLEWKNQLSVAISHHFS